MSRGVQAFDRLRGRLIVFSMLVVLLLLATVFAGSLCPYDPYVQDPANALAPPSWAHPFGTDRFGRDMLSRVIIGARTSIFSSLALVGIIALGGSLIGVCCAVCGRNVDAAVMRIADVCLSFPGLVFALAIAAVLDGGVDSAVIALAAISWPKYARLARSQTLSLLSADHIAAARLAGNTTLGLIGRHILPNIGGPLLVTAVLDIGTMMMEIAALSFLGLGAKPPTAEWGSMMSAGRSLLWVYPWVVLTPGIGIFVSVVIFNLFGDTLRDALDPRNRRG